jgi:cell wall-associated NlpC family hydrolase
MNFFKNTLLSIIAIQVLVLAQLSIVKYSNNTTYANILRGTLFASDTSSSPKLPLIIQTTLFSPKQKILDSSIPEQLKNEMRMLTSSQLSSDSLAFLYTSRKTEERICTKVEKNAKKLLGLKYVWGATGPNKFDCSGFTQKVYKTAGIKIPRNSRAQAKVGQYIKYENLQKGDMVFFDTNRKKTGRVNHVGIYLEDGKFIHASSGNKKVVITNFDKKRYYKSRFLWGRRIINNSVQGLHLSKSSV